MLVRKCCTGTWPLAGVFNKWLPKEAEGEAGKAQLQQETSASLG